MSGMAQTMRSFIHSHPPLGWESKDNNSNANGGWGDNQQQQHQASEGVNPQATEGSGDLSGWGSNDAPSGRPDFSKRGGDRGADRGGDRRPDWRELHGVKQESLEETQKNVDNLLQTLQTVEVKLADKQADVNSPLYSAKSFEQLGLYL